MRLPTVELVVRSALHAVRRFPLVIAASLVAAAAALALVDHSGDSSEHTRLLASYTRLLVSATLGFPLLFALSMLAERRARTAVARWGMLAVGVLVLVWFWAVWPSWSTPVQVLRCAQLSVAFHLMVAFLPYVGYDEPTGFWQYNKALFIRFLTASIYSSVLYAGLAIALLALDKLLGVHVASESYARLWIVIAFVFNTWFFVGGVPDDLGALEQNADYPTGLKIFTQYVLVPIVAIYLLILTLYLGKVLITRAWPNGWIGYLVSGVASVGILSWLLVHPLEERAEYAWVKAFTKGFYILLMPAIVMLWLAIGKRVGQYGITEPRYFLIVLSVWLASIAVYYTVTKVRSIKVIPATLCAVALLTFAGPWGAYAVSRVSQVSRLRAILVRNDLLAGGMLRPATATVSLEDRRELSSGFRYLLNTHGTSAIAAWLSDSLARSLAKPPWQSGEGRASAVMAALHVGYLAPWDASPGQYVSFYTNAPTTPVYIGGYTQALHLSFWAVRDSLRIADGTFLRLARDSTGLEIMRNGAVLLAIPLQPMVDSAAAYRRANPAQVLPPELLRVETRSGDVAALVSLTQLTGMNRPGGIRLTSFEGELFLRLP